VTDSQRQVGKSIHRQTGPTFYAATRLLPRDIREETYVLYGFCRITDEVVDGEDGRSPAAQRRRLEELRRAALGKSEAFHPVVDAFATLRREVGIPDEEVNAFVDAMCTDIDTERYETYDDLATYMRGSAGAVGNMMTAIMGVRDESVRPHAMALGEAFQLTNFLRDVREDAEELGRVYLPEETLARFAISAEDVLAGTTGPGLRRAVRWELHRAEQRYRTGVAGIEELPADCQFPVLLAAVLYAEHHRLIRRLDFDVRSSRPSLSTSRKAWVLGRTAWHWRACRDPVSVFRRVSPVPAEAEVPSGPRSGDGLGDDQLTKLPGPG